MNLKYKTEYNGRHLPDKNDEYFLYQTLIGAFPFEETPDDNFVKRIRDYAIKVVREAKVYTAWVKPDVTYENAFLRFIEKILSASDTNLFLNDLIEFQKYISYSGIFNSLSQTLIKMTVPGIPDFYQGSELWDLNLVDPDNRRPVDFAGREELLNFIDNNQKDKNKLFEYLLSDMKNGAVKLYLIRKVMAARRRYPTLFNEGKYSHINSSGEFGKNVISFMRKNENHIAVIIAPRFITEVTEQNKLPLGKKIWENTFIRVPFETDKLENVITDAITGGGTTLQIGEILKEFPVALLIGKIMRQ